MIWQLKNEIKEIDDVLIFYLSEMSLKSRVVVVKHLLSTHEYDAY